MTRIRDIVKIMEDWAPQVLAEDWDNVGLITGDPESPVERVVVTLEATPQTLASALENGARMLITHHPPVFKPLRKFTGTSVAAALLREAIKNDLAIFTAHTNLDRAPDGVCGALAKLIDLENTSILVPSGSDTLKFVTYCPPEYTDAIRDAAGAAGAGAIGEYSACSFTSTGTGTFIPSNRARPHSGSRGKLSRKPEERLEMIIPSALAPSVIAAARLAHPYDEMAYDLVRLDNPDSTFGYGAVGDLREPMDADAFIAYAGDTLGVSSLSHSPVVSGTISRVAVLGGKGAFGTGQAIRSGADVFITGEIGHHDFLDHGGDILLIDAGHRETELPVLESIRSRLMKGLPRGDVDIVIDRGGPTRMFRSFKS